MLAEQVGIGGLGYVGVSRFRDRSQTGLQYERSKRDADRVLTTCQTPTTAMPVTAVVIMAPHVGARAKSLSRATSISVSVDDGTRLKAREASIYHSPGPARDISKGSLRHGNHLFTMQKQTLARANQNQQ